MPSTDFSAIPEWLEKQRGKMQVYHLGNVEVKEEMVIFINVDVVAIKGVLYGDTHTCQSSIF